MRRQLNLNTPIDQEATKANTVSCIERHDGFLKVIDGTLVSRRRPGMVEFSDLTTGEVKGAYYWVAKDIVLAVKGTSLYKVTSAGTKTLIGTVAGSRRAVFAEFRTPSEQVLIACGAAMYVTDGSTVAAISDPDAPTAVSHVRHFQQYALATEVGTQFVYYSDALTFDPEDWAGDVFSAEGSPDDIVAMFTGFDEIILFGERSVERYYNDGVNPFSRIQGGTVEYGCVAPYSIQLIQSTHFYLTHERKLVRMAGSETAVISLPVNLTVRNLTTVSDAIGMHDAERGLYILSFPADDVTLVYDYNLNAWIGEWNYWDTGTASYERWKGNCMVYVPEWGKTIVGDHTNGKLYYLDEDVYQDDGETMRGSVITANISGKNYEWITSQRLDVLLKRGHGSSSPVFKMRYRSNGSQTWSNTKDGSIGNTGDNEYRVTFRQLGRYRSRQYEIYCTDDAPFEIITAFEDAQ